jgi:hypothetical protein
VWWLLPIIPVLGRLKQEDCKFKANLGYTEKHCLKKRKEGKEKEGLSSVFSCSPSPDSQCLGLIIIGSIIGCACLFLS